MSEPGNTGRTLAEFMHTMAEEVAPAIQGQGPAAAQRRGHIRTTRRRIASFLVVLVGLGGVAAIVSGHGSTASTGPATLPTAVTQASPSAARHGADPNTPNPAAWLPPEQLPFAAELHWRLDDSSSIGVEFGPENNLGTCLSGDPGAFGAYRTFQQGPTWSSGVGDIATEQVYSAQFFFPSESAATEGLASIEISYGECQGVGTAGSHVIDTVKTTASGQGRIAILRTVRTPNGGSTSTPTVNSDSHEYVVQDGTVIYFVGIYGDSVIDPAGNDATILQAMHDALERYQK